MISEPYRKERSPLLLFEMPEFNFPIPSLPLSLPPSLPQRRGKRGGHIGRLPARAQCAACVPSCETSLGRRDGRQRRCSRLLLSSPTATVAPRLLWGAEVQVRKGGWGVPGGARRAHFRESGGRSHGLQGPSGRDVTDAFAGMSGDTCLRGDWSDGLPPVYSPAPPEISFHWGGGFRVAVSGIFSPRGSVVAHARAIRGVQAWCGPCR